jgi:hypothetical protein
MTAELRNAFAEAERRDRFWADNYADFLERYPEMMVAAKDGKVVAAESSLEELLASLRRLGLSPHNDVWIQWVSKSMRCLVL